MNFEQVALLDDQLDSLKDSLYDAKLEKEVNKGKEELEKKVSERKAKDSGEIVVDAWVQQNPWANAKKKEYDPIMFGAAVEVEKLLSADPVWGKKDLDERLGEVKKIVEGRFNYGKPKASPPSAVEGVGGAMPANGTPVSLTEDEKYVAVRIFPNLDAKDAEKKYLAQKIIIHGGK